MDGSLNRVPNRRTQRVSSAIPAEWEKKKARKAEHLRSQEYTGCAKSACHPKVRHGCFCKPIPALHLQEPDQASRRMSRGLGGPELTGPRRGAATSMCTRRPESRRHCSGVLKRCQGQAVRSLLQWKVQRSASMRGCAGHQFPKFQSDARVQPLAAADTGVASARNKHCTCAEQSTCHGGLATDTPCQLARSPSFWQWRAAKCGSSSEPTHNSKAQSWRRERAEKRWRRRGTAQGTDDHVHGTDVFSRREGGDSCPHERIKWRALHPTPTNRRCKLHRQKELTPSRGLAELTNSSVTRTGTWRGV